MDRGLNDWDRYNPWNFILGDPFADPPGQSGVRLVPGTTTAFPPFTDALWAMTYPCRAWLDYTETYTLDTYPNL